MEMLGKAITHCGDGGSGAGVSREPLCPTGTTRAGGATLGLLHTDILAFILKKSVSFFSPKNPFALVYFRKIKE